MEGAGILVDTWHFFHGPDRWDDLEELTVTTAFPEGFLNARDAKAQAASLAR